MTRSLSTLPDSPIPVSIDDRVSDASNDAEAGNMQANTGVAVLVGVFLASMVVVVLVEAIRRIVM